MLSKGEHIGDGHYKGVDGGGEQVTQHCLSNQGSPPGGDDISAEGRSMSDC